MEETDELSKGTSQKPEMRMNELLANEDENEEEAPIDFGIPPTPTLDVPKRTSAPRNLKKDKKCQCCNIL